MYHFLTSLTGRVLQALFVGIYVWTHAWAAYADAIQDGAAAGMLTGRTSPTASVTQSGGNFVFNPGSPNEINLAPADLFPQDTTGGPNLQDSFGDNRAVLNAGDSAAATLSTGTNSEAQAYQTIMGMRDVEQPDLRNDPIFNSYDGIAGNIDGLAADFSECSVNTELQETTTTAHVPDYKTCERVQDGSGVYTIHHDYKVGVIRHVDGPLNLASCGAGCTRFWLGRVADNYWGGNCTIYEQQITLELMKPDAVTGAYIDHMYWDDYQRVHVMDWQKAGDYTGEEQYWRDWGWIFAGPNANFPPETGGACELNTNWNWTGNFDMTWFMRYGRFKRFKVRTSVSGAGEGYARGYVTYDPNQVVTDGGWYPEEALSVVQQAEDGFCTDVQARCVDSPPLDADGCATINGVYVCEDQLEPSPIEGISPFCRRVEYSASCDFYVGQMECWTDPEGVERCPYNAGGNLDSCEQFEADPSCGFISSQCVEGAETSDGTCLVQEETWDCGYDTTIASWEQVREIQCDGPLACVGTDCMQALDPAAGDFATAAAAFEAAKYMAMDTTCTEGQDQNVTCSVFEGESYECKKAVGGIVNCCESPDAGISLADYISLVSAIGSIDTAMNNPMMNGTAVQGAWNQLAQPFDSAWSAVQKPFVQAWESVAGPSEVAADATTQGIFSVAKQKLMTATVEWTAQAFGPEAANLLFSSVATDGTVGVAVEASGQLAGGTLQLGGGGAVVGTALGYIMWAYTIYQITMILIQLIWQCEEREFELGVKRQLKNCRHVGSYCKSEFLGACIEKREAYCCFNSPLSRILQEQVRAQHGMSWGSPETPSCGGLSSEVLAATDWQAIDLSEWMALLNVAGKLPSEHTGFDSFHSQTFFDTDGTRENAVERTINRVDDLDTSAIRQEAQDEF